MDTTAIILAVASPPGRSWRGIVRASGRGCFDLLRPHVQAPWSRGAHLARLRAAPLDLPCVALILPGPRSYTGEDSLELQLPGNPALLDRVIDAVIASGRKRSLEARRGEPGEFTARAFLNGRMSLIQAEGVAATIAAESDAQLRAAGLLLDGRLGALAAGLADDLAGLLAQVEAGIDFTDQEDVVTIGPAALLEGLASLRDRLDEHLGRAVGAEALGAIPWVVLAGPPNAGKSTLFNALLGRPRAVVSEMAGTTRDVLAEPLCVETGHGPAEVMLADLAGDAAAVSALDRQAQWAARRAIGRAELVLRCAPVGDPAPPPGPGELVVRTKADLDHAAVGDLKVSAFSGAGLGTLRELIARRLADRAVSLAADALALQPRHDAQLRRARQELAGAIDLVAPVREERHLPGAELVAAAMRAALDGLAALAGDVSPDDILGRIFATFCVGK